MSARAPDWTGAAGRARPLFRELLTLSRYLRPYASLQALVLLGALLASAIGLVGPLLTRLTLDEAFGKRDLVLFHALLLAGLTLYLFQGGLRLLTQYLSAYVGNRLGFDLRRQYVRHVFRLPYLEFQRRPTGEHLYRLGADIDTSASLATDTVPQILVAALRLVLLSALCFHLNWALALAAVAAVPLFWLHSRHFGARQRRVAQDLRQASQDLSASTQDLVANYRLLRLLGRRHWAVRDYLRRRVAIVRLGLRATAVSMIGGGTSGALNTLVMAAIMYYVGVQVVAGRLTLGTLVAILLYLAQLVSTLAQAGGLYRDALARLVAWERVRDVLDQPAEPCETGSRLPADWGGSVACRDLSFAYAPDRLVLHGVSLDVRDGEFVGIVGPSGSGKTTLLMAVLGLIRPAQGSVQVGGVSLERIDAPALRRAVGVAPQEAGVLNLSVAGNLRLARAEAADSELWRALEIADLAETVRGLPGALAAPVGEKGASLSEGQRQRLSLARAVLGAPRLLVLDEATSAISPDSEARIMDRLRTALPHATILFSSHRLTALRLADRVVVLENGLVTAEGHPSTLAARSAFFRSLQAQSAGMSEGRR